MDEELVKLEDMTDEIVIDLEESIGWVVGDTTRHDSLVGRNDDDQHEIKAIEGLSNELESLKSLAKTVYSNKIGVANYYKCTDGPYDGYGHFVTMDGADTVKKCNSNNNDNIFGVTVSDAAFVGGQFDTVVKNSDGSYTHTLVQNNDSVLVATTGLVSVRCVSDVSVGDFVVSNVDGVARKTETMSGYKVVAIHTDNDSIKYASIMLDVQADVTDKISASVSDLDSRLQSAETNIISAMNLANRAISELNNIDTSKLVTSDKLEAIEDAANDAVAKADGALSDAINSSILASQAKEIANSAATSAEAAKNEAIKEANKALEETLALREDFSTMGNTIQDIEGNYTVVRKTISAQYKVVKSWDKANKDEINVVYYAEDTKKYHYYDNNVWKETTDAAIAGLPVAIAGIQTKTDENSSSINNLTSWQGETKNTMARLEQKADENGAYIQSTVINMDKYAVGSHSQAYGFALEQSADILDEGMMYVPTDNLTETYNYTDGDEKKTYTQEFYREYLYRWSKINDQYKWIPVDKNYVEIDVNTSGPSVYFVSAMPTTVDTTHGYWYKTGATTGDTETEYEPHVLYKWMEYTTKDEEGKDTTGHCWTPVATLAGNSKSRAVSQIRQDADRIEASITTIDGKYAGTHAFIKDNESVLQDIVSWKGDNGESLATFASNAGDNFASASQVASIVDEDGNVNAASIVAAVVEDESSIALLANNIQLQANEIDLTGYVKFTDLSGSGTTEINGENIITGSLAANLIHSKNYEHKDGDGNIAAPSTSTDKPVPYSDNGTFLDLSDGALYSKNFVIDGDGDAYFKGEVHADGGNIAQWAITSDGFTKVFESESGDYTVGLYAEADKLGLDHSTTLYVAKNDDPQFYVRPTGYMFAKYGNIAGWDITENSLTKGEIKLTTDDSIKRKSLFNGDMTPVRFCVNPKRVESFFECTAYLENGLLVDPIYAPGDMNFIDNISAFWFADIYNDSHESISIAEIPNFALDENKKIVMVQDGLMFQENGTSSPMTGWYDLKFGFSYVTSPFSVLSDGSLYADAISSAVGKFSINSDGTGYFAGWNFDNDSIYKEQIMNGKKYRVLMNSNMYTQSNDNPYNPVFGIADRTNDGWDFNFYVRSNGQLYVKDAEIHGKIFAEQGGSIGGWTITNDGLQSTRDDRTSGFETSQNGGTTFFIGRNKQGQTPFSVDNNGVVRAVDIQLSNEVKFFGGLFDAEMGRISCKPSDFNIWTDSWSDANNVDFVIEGKASGKNILAGTWYVGDLGSPSKITSDANMKNNITSVSDKYDIVFDNLRAVTFKYNNGDSGRLHTGFIAQEVGHALQCADISTQEFAGLCIDNKGMENEKWSLRYDEFVSLNTWQIQKLKPRVTSLEEKVQALETENEQLKEQINLLLNK